MGGSQLIAVSIKDSHVLVSIAVVLLANLRKCIAALYCVGLTALALGLAAHGRSLRGALADSYIGDDVVSVWVHQFDLVPNLVSRVLRRGDGFNEQLVVLNM